ncbi:MAG: hypothetical protein Q7S53_03055 [bacterium]|nr:hypothetical protein [bacterium]
MKKIFKNKVVWILVGALVIGFGGTVAYLSMTDSQKKSDQSKQDTTKSNNDSAGTQTEKGNLPADQPVVKTPVPVQEKAPTDTSTSLGSLISSVTAQKNPSDDTIAILFYLESSGTFTSQEKSGTSWVTISENQSYSGRGGFSAGSLAAGQASKTVRVLKIENGKYTAVTKEFTVTRSEVEAALGIKTYN